MPQQLKAGLLAIAFFALTLGSVETARADIVMSTGVSSGDTDNVLLNPATNVTTVTGTVGSNNLLVNFTSTSGSGLLGANPAGQATIFGGTGNTSFTQLTFDLANDDLFTQAIFNINAAINGSVLIRVEDTFGGIFETTFAIAGAGENFFTVSAINGQLIDYVSLTAINGATFEDLRQVRLGGGDIGAPVGSVPEPGSLALLGLGLAGLAFTRRRKH